MESGKTNKSTATVMTQPQRKFSAKEILADIRQGMSDPDFERKYRLTSDGRKKLFKKLIDVKLQLRPDFSLQFAF